VRALVTGAGGFVGSHLTAHLRSCGDEVIETDRSTTGLDICDLTALTELFTTSAPDVIYHLAGDSDVGGSWDHPLDTFRANAEGTMSVLMAARRSGTDRVLCVSSADVYGRVPASALPITEAQPLAPVSPYAVSKVAADMIAWQAWLGHGQDVIRIRAFNHLGPGQSDRFVAPAIAGRIVAAQHSGARTIPVGNLTPERDLTDVRDVARAYRLLAEHGTAGTAYNVCSGHAVSVGELANQLVRLAGSDVELIVDPDLQRPVDTPVLIGDHSLLTGTTGWEPRIPLTQTLTDLIDDCRLHPGAGVSPTAS